MPSELAFPTAYLLIYENTFVLVLRTRTRLPFSLYSRSGSARRQEHAPGGPQRAAGGGTVRGDRVLRGKTRFRQPGTQTRAVCVSCFLLVHALFLFFRLSCGRHGIRRVLVERSLPRSTAAAAAAVLCPCFLAAFALRQTVSVKRVDSVLCVTPYPLSYFRRVCLGTACSQTSKPNILGPPPPPELRLASDASPLAPHPPPLRSPKIAVFPQASHVRRSGYIRQWHAGFAEGLSVFDNLVFAAMLRMPNGLLEDQTAGVET